MTSRHIALWTLSLVLVCRTYGEAVGDGWQVLRPSETLQDGRLEPLKDLNGYFPMREFESIEAWRAQADRLRTSLQVAVGLYPMPKRTPPNAVIHGRQELDGYSVENVYFESFPGYYVTGNLYRPLESDAARRPAVLCPHGHYSNGRFTDAGIDGVRRQIVDGAERFENGGRNPVQARCVQLARMGCVVFSYDMVGYCDSIQLSSQLAHRFAEQRPSLNRAERWGLFSPQAESMLQSIFGIQTYNSLRAFDWISELPDVDPQRIGVTGSSGGGTQTFILGALESRLAAVAPAVMVSTAMQGGCTCENASLLRVGRGNVDIAALIAPKPLCLISADDWTVEMPSKGFPELKRHYEMLGIGDRLEHHPLLHFGHNYNYVSRGRMYRFMNEYLKLGLKEPIVEEDYPRQTSETLSVWNDDHPAPETGEEVEVALLRKWTNDTEQQLASMRPQDDASLQAFQEFMTPALDEIIGRSVDDMGSIEFDLRRKEEQSGVLRMSGLLQHRPKRFDPGREQPVESIPIWFLMPKSWQQGSVAIWLDANGKSGLLDGDTWRPEIARLLAEGVAVVGADLIEQGEHRTEGSTSTEELQTTRRVDNPREAAAYTLGYNHALFAQRVHDIMTVVKFCHDHPRQPRGIWLIGTEGSGKWAAAARAQLGELVTRSAIDTEGFRFLEVDDVRHPDLLPGGAKYFDLMGMIAVETSPLWLAGESDASAKLVQAAFSAAGNSTLAVAPQTDAIDWLLK